MIESIALLVVDMLQSQHAPILSVYSHKYVETTNDMPFCLVETIEGTYLLRCWKHVLTNQDYFGSIKILLTK